jgi:hypothetical protein
MKHDDLRKKLHRFAKAMEPYGYRKPIKHNYVQQAKTLGIKTYAEDDQRDARVNVSTYKDYQKDLES